jgi:hypothetical protein
MITGEVAQIFPCFDKVVSLMILALLFFAGINTQRSIQRAITGHGGHKKRTAENQQQRPITLKITKEKENNNRYRNGQSENSVYGPFIYLHVSLPRGRSVTCLTARILISLFLYIKSLCGIIKKN